MLICKVALLAGPCGVAAADPREPGLNWVRLPAAESCISAAELARRVEALVGRILFVPAAEAAMSVDAHVRRLEPPGWAVSVELSDPDGKVRGRRQLRFAGDDCRVIDDAVSFVIAVTLYPGTSLMEAGVPLEPGIRANLDALFGDEPIDPEPPELAQQEPRALAAPRPAPAPGVAAPKAVVARPPSPAGEPGTRGWQLALDAAVSGRLGQLPALAGGFRLGISLTPPAFWPVELSVANSFPQERTSSTGSASFDWLGATLALCPPHYSAADLELSLCAGAEVGRMKVEPAFTSLQNRPASSDVSVLITLAEVLEVGVWDGLFLRASAGVSVPLPSRQYTLATGASRQEFFRPWPVVLRLEVGMGWRFGP